MALGQHIVLRLTDSRVIAPSPVERRRVARAVLEQGRQDQLLAFGLADTHLHLLATCSRPAAGQLARRVALSLGRSLRLLVGFVPAYFKPVDDSWHLQRAFTYVLEQGAHHGLEWDPLHEASNLPDLLGLRLLGGYTAASVRSQLPRIAREDLLARLQLRELLPADGPMEHLQWATLAAAVLPSLAGKSRAAGAARHALIEIAGRRLPARELAVMAGVSQRIVYKLRMNAADARLSRAIRLQLGLIRERAPALLDRDHPFTCCGG